jgi:cellulose biosynthesis protein BcsQ
MDGYLKRVTDLLLDFFTRATPPVQIGFLVILLTLLALLLYLFIRKRHKFEQMRIERDAARNQVRDKELLLRDVQTKLTDVTARSDVLDKQVGNLTTEKGRLEQQRDTAQGQEEETADQLTRSKEELAALQKRFDGLQRIDTDIWLGPTGSSSAPPRFLPRPGRRTRFVAFLNLKGGVGKTTLAANLGAAFATGVTGAPMRVLLIDLDYQGTLSNMCVGRDMLDDRRKNKNTSRLLLGDENQAKTSEDVLLPLMAPVEGTDGRARIVVAHEDLDNIDFRQQARFAVEQWEVRFHHRKILHDPFVVDQFDLVFFDCPPRLTTSVINALTASDWIVLPTSLHPNDAGAVPRTLQWLDKLQAVNTFQARLAGVVLNRTYRKGTTSELTKDEVLVLASLQKDVQRYMPGGNIVIQDVVPNHPDVARYAAGSVPLGAHKEGREIYKRVAEELHKRM